MLTFSDGIVCNMTSIAYSFMNNKSSGYGNCEPIRRSTETFTRSISVNDVPSSGGTFPKQSRRKSRTRRKPLIAKVQICVQFFKVGEIDTLKEQFTADVVVKAKWREPTLDGQNKTAENVDFSKVWNPKLYIENSYGDPKEQLRYRILYNDKGEAYISEKRVIKGTFMENLELDDFPFDVQDLTITVVSELPSYEVELIEDETDHHVVNRQSFVDEQEWHLYMHTECTRKDIVIDQADNSVRRSALSVKCRAARRPGYFIWNIFMVTFLICSLSFATFSVKKTLPHNRLQLSFTLVLTAVAFKSVVNNSLPRISYLTYMDKYLLAAMIMLSTVCVWHAVVTTLPPDLADEIERYILTILTVIYLVYNIGFLIVIYLVPWRKRRLMKQKDRDYKDSLPFPGSISYNLLPVEKTASNGSDCRNGGTSFQLKVLNDDVVFSSNEDLSNIKNQTTHLDPDDIETNMAGPHDLSVSRSGSLVVSNSNMEEDVVSLNPKGSDMFGNCSQVGFQ